MIFLPFLSWTSYTILLSSVRIFPAQVFSAWLYFEKDLPIPCLLLCRLTLWLGPHYPSLSCPEEGLKTEGVVLHSVNLLEYFCPKHLMVRILSPRRHLYTQTWVKYFPRRRGGGACSWYSCLSYTITIVVVVLNEVDNVIQLLLYLLCLIFRRTKSSV